MLKSIRISHVWVLDQDQARQDEGEAPDETMGQTVLCPECRFNIPVPDPRANKVSPGPRDRPSRPPRTEDRRAQPLMSSLFSMRFCRFWSAVLFC